MNKGIAALSLAIIFGVQAASSVFAFGPAKPSVSDPFADKRQKIAACETSDIDIGYNFREAARLARFDLMKCLVEERDPSVIDSVDEDGISALLYALVKQGNEDPAITEQRNMIFDYLVEESPHLLSVKDKHGSGVLAYMAMNDYIDRLEAALDLGLDMNELDSPVDEKGRPDKNARTASPYGEAKSYGNTRIVAAFEKYAAEHGIVINQDKDHVPVFPEKAQPDRRPDGSPAPSLQELGLEDEDQQTPPPSGPFSVPGL